MPWPDPWGLLILFAFAGVLVTLGATWAVVRGLLYPPRKTYAVALARGLPTHPDGTMPRGGIELTLTLSDGTETPAFLVHGERPDGPTVVVVHGFGDGRYGALTWAPLVIPHAREVLVYDLRGHGESEAKRAEIVVGDTRDLLRILEELEAPGGVVLFGYSMGAGIAIGAAAALASLPLPPGEGAEERSDEAGEGGRDVTSRPLRKDTAAALTPALSRGERELSRRPHIPRILGVIADGPYRTWEEPIVRHIRDRGWPAQPFTFLAGLVLRMMLAGSGGLGFDRVEDAAKLRCPLLVLHGARDRLCPLASAEAITLAAAENELVIIEEGGHLDLAAVDEARYRAALARFFDRIPHGSAPPLDPRNPTPPRGSDRPHAAQGGSAAG